jgi:predicted ribosome quality control (RQC) complex YloA/Tae2 family protein
MSLSNQELADVIVELRACLLGAQLQKINSPTKAVAQLAFRSAGLNHFLLIDLTPGSTRLHLIKEKLAGLASPPSWVMKCRSELGNAVLAGIDQDDNDRTIRLGFKTKTPPAELVLIAELFGRKGRLLLAKRSGEILESLIGSATVGQLYSKPTKAMPGPGPSSRFVKADPLTLQANFAIAEHYQQAEIQKSFEREYKRLAGLLNREAKRVKSRQKKMHKDLTGSYAAEDMSRQAEALKLNLGRVPKGRRSIELNDPYNPEADSIVVALDPALSAVDNMNRLFKKSRRLSRARPKIEQRLEEEKNRLEKIIAFREQLETLQTIDQLEQLRAKLEDAGLKDKKPAIKKRSEPRLPYRQYQAKNGNDILVGRSARDNHQLTFHIARGSDLWLHARGRSGAHVVVRLTKNQSIDEQTLLDAATLAAQFSGLKNPEKVEVTYSLVKNLHPIKGHPGTVSVAKGRTILVRVEEDRLKRLKASRK